MVGKEGYTSYFDFCYEVNLAFVPIYTWWVDSGATTYISISIQDCLWSRSPNNVESFIYVGDDKAVPVKAIGNFRLLLKTGCFLDSIETFIV